MRRFLIRFVLWSSILGLGLAGLLLVLVTVIDPNHHKDHLQSWIEGYTGQKLTFNGTITFTGLPKPGLRFENVGWRPQGARFNSIGSLHAQTLHWWFAPHLLLTEPSFGYVQIMGLDADRRPLRLPLPVNSPPEETFISSPKEESVSHPVDWAGAIHSLPPIDQSLTDTPFLVEGIVLDLGPMRWQYAPFTLKAKVQRANQNLLMGSGPIKGQSNGLAAKIRTQGAVFRGKSHTKLRATIEHIEVIHEEEGGLYSSFQVSTPCHITPTRVRCTDFALHGSLTRTALRESVRFAINSPELLIDAQKMHAQELIIKTQWGLTDRSAHPCMRRIEAKVTIAGEAAINWTSQEGHFRRIRGTGSVIPNNCPIIPFTLTAEAAFSLNPAWLTIPYLHVDLPQVTLNDGKGEGHIVITDAVANPEEHIYSLASMDAVGHLSQLTQQPVHIPIVASVDNIVLDKGLRTGAIRFESEAFQALGVEGTARIAGKRLLESPSGQFSLEHIKATGHLNQGPGRQGHWSFTSPLSVVLNKEELEIKEPRVRLTDMQFAEHQGEIEFHSQQLFMNWVTPAITGEHIVTTGKLWGSTAARRLTPINVIQFSAIGTFIGNMQTGDYVLAPITLELIPPILGRWRLSGEMRADLTRDPLMRRDGPKIGESPNPLSSLPSSILALTFNGIVHHFDQQTSLKQSSEANQIRLLPEITSPSPPLSLKDEEVDKKASGIELPNPHRTFNPFDLPETERESSGIPTSGSMVVAYNAHQLRLQDIDLLIDDVRTRGSFEVFTDAPSPTRFDLVIDQLNADRYLPPSIGAFLSAQLLSMRFPIHLPGGFLQKQNTEGRLIINKLTLHDMAIEELVLELQRDGEMIINADSLAKTPRH